MLFNSLDPKVFEISYGEVKRDVSPPSIEEVSSGQEDEEENPQGAYDDDGISTEESDQILENADFIHF